ncbi:MAG: HAMP domain-containing protein, partial [Verrucomicrobiae bacterium]|nr:HAMP domain-containing protein [Verrucomicrobiae bacterium]
MAALDRELRTLAYRRPGWISGNASLERVTSSIEFVFGEDRKDQLLLLVKDGDGLTRYQSPHWPADLDPDAIDLALKDAGSVGDGDADTVSERTPRGPPWAESEGTWRSRGGGRQASPFTKAPRFCFVKTASSLWRVGVMGNDRERLVLALNCAGLQEELHRLRNGFLVVLPLALLLIGWGGWWVAGQAVRPLRRIADVADGMTARGLDQRIPSSGEDPEINRLIRVLNGMMDRLEASFRQATRFGADASHELKTPLAVMQGELEHALQSATPGSPEQRVFANLLEETQRLKTITRGLLLLARADAGQLPLTLESVDLGEALEELTEDIEALAAQHRIRVERSETPGLRVRGDATLLRQAMQNLLHNAVHYNETDGWIGITLNRQDTEVRFEVSNGGPGIAEAERPRLFERF